MSAGEMPRSAVDRDGSARPARAAFRRSRARGFTLIELMVAMSTGLAVISSLYVLSHASTRSFYIQSDISETQLALRMAMEQLRRDISRAGFLATPDTSTLIGCPEDASAGSASSASFQSVDVTYPTVDERIIDPNTLNGSREDMLDLVGNYATSERYLVQSIVSGTTVYLQESRASFMRSFNDSDGATDKDLFKRVFSSGRMLRVEVFSPTHRVFFRTITSSDIDADGTDPRITLGSALPTNPACIAGDSTLGAGLGAIVAPVSKIRYRIMKPTDSNALKALYTINSNRPGARPKDLAVLVRQELSFSDVVKANSTRPVLEYATDFRIRLLYQQNSVTGTILEAEAITNGTAHAALDTPALIRGLSLSLAKRSRRAEPSARSASGGFLLEGSTNAETARWTAHSRELHSTIMLANNR